MEFFDKSLLQRFDFERFLIVRTIPFERKALWVSQSVRSIVRSTTMMSRRRSIAMAEPFAMERVGARLAHSGSTEVNPMVVFS